MTQQEKLSERRAPVLVVDDSPLLLEALKRRLESEFDVSCASGGLEALDMLAGPKMFNVIVCDYQMPGMSGLEVLSRVAERHPEVSRIVLTGYSNLDLAIEVLNGVPIHKFLCKPCGEGDLCRAVRSAAQASREWSAREIGQGEQEFTNQALVQQNRALEERIQEHVKSISNFRRLAVQLTQVESLAEIARVCAEVAFEALGGRGIFIQIYEEDGTTVEHCLGPEMSACMISEPLATPHGPIGELVTDVIAPDGRRTCTTDQHLLAAIASTAGVAAHNDLRRRERDEAQYTTVVALARLSEQRDEETGLHLERVSKFCRLIAESLVSHGDYVDVIDDDFLDDLVHSAPLHDIGKVGIPDSILLKQGKLTDSEWVIMKTHAALGAETLRSVAEGQGAMGYLHMGIDIAQSHHERWDGSGYPDGLAGQDIPLSARILALSDVYDALTSARPYKGAWAHEEALALIEENRGTHFDPCVVDAFKARHVEAAEIRSQLRDDLNELTPILGPIGKIA